MSRGDDHELTTALRTRFVPSEAPDTLFVLRVVQGPDNGLVHALDEGSPSRLLLGASEACAFRLRCARARVT